MNSQTHGNETAETAHEPGTQPKLLTDTGLYGMIYGLAGIGTAIGVVVIVLVHIPVAGEATPPVDIGEMLLAVGLGAIASSFFKRCHDDIRRLDAEASAALEISQKQRQQAEHQALRQLFRHG